VKIAETHRQAMPVAPPQALGPQANPLLMRYPGSSKLHADHVAKLAVVYVRQSSPKQVVENREATARQYALADYAVALG
jgi:hypothetical protein